MQSAYNFIAQIDYYGITLFGESHLICRGQKPFYGFGFGGNEFYSARYFARRSYCVPRRIVKFAFGKPERIIFGIYIVCVRRKIERADRIAFVASLISGQTFPAFLFGSGT